MGGRDGGERVAAVAPSSRKTKKRVGQNVTAVKGMMETDDKGARIQIQSPSATTALEL